MNRREFLQSGTVLGASVLTGTFGAPRAAEDRTASGPTGRGLRAVRHRRPKPKLLLSLAAYSFRKELQSGKMSLEDFVDFCALHDLEATELTSYYFKDTSPAYLAELRRRAYVNGLTITSEVRARDSSHLPRHGGAQFGPTPGARPWLLHPGDPPAYSPRPMSLR